LSDLVQPRRRLLGLLAVSQNKSLIPRSLDSES
jgi:hypothetical protein